MALTVCPGVAQAQQWLKERQVQRVEIEWKEDVRVWHPGQAWIWQPGGMGVFDPGINALSIATAILPQPFFLQRARLLVPSNAQTPIAAELAFTDPKGAVIAADFDFRQSGPPTWDMHIETDEGRLSLTNGGCRLVINDEVIMEAEEREYQGLYARFAELIANKRSEVDVARCARSPMHFYTVIVKPPTLSLSNARATFVYSRLPSTRRDTPAGLPSRIASGRRPSGSAW
ncbi:hypothetical protein HSBAA_57040 [Vreelandella sulfidaeris]|uniref:Uncharacterized protein n=1 Tax=Vreelandella sulfidaeris TaxID=115553 RepID=A0A455UJ63_9GAMM|nr:hypothetical protein HSBAA_57040 [Halomonas sulfidaeris]